MSKVWAVILGLGLATYLIRWSFVGLIGDRTLRPRLREALDFVPVTVIPALVAPMVLAPADGISGAELAGAAAVLAAGAWSGRLLTGLAAGVAVWALVGWAG